MQLVLPPSETKALGGSGGPLDLTSLGFASLTATRERVAGALVRLARTPRSCRTVLGLSQRQDDEIARNAALWTNPTMPALERYTGVLYDAIGFAGLPATARGRAAAHVVVCSALFGLLRANDPIPAYRLSAGISLPKLGALGAVWRPALGPALDGTEPIIDLRSAAYVGLGRLPGAIDVRVVQPDGRAVSHHNKAIKGRLVRAFLTARTAPRTIDELIAVARRSGITVVQNAEHGLQIVAAP